MPLDALAVPMKSKSFASAARDLAAVGRRFYARGWVLGTSGNFSTVVAGSPLRLAITASSVHKGQLRPADILPVDDRGTVVGRRSAKPSAETLLHVEIIRRRGAGAVLHTHSIWSTILSGAAPSRDGKDGIMIEGFEMLKGLDGVGTRWEKSIRAFAPSCHTAAERRSPPALAGGRSRTIVGSRRIC